MVSEVVCTVLGLFVIVLVIRIVLSWFPISPGSALSSVYGVVYSITEPVLGPVRRILPSVGMLDLSPIVIFIVVRILQTSLGCSGFF